MKKLIVIGMLIAATQSWAQIDEKRMDRDLEVAKNILGTLMADNNDYMMIGRNMIETSYLPGYGVTFSLPQEPFFMHFSMPKIKINRVGPDSYKYKYKMGDKTEEAEQSENEAIEVLIDTESDNDSGEENDDPTQEIRQAIITFFADYADLIGQLGPESRIRIVQKQAPEFAVIAWSDDRGGESAVDEKIQGFSAEIYKKDITAYKDNKISLDEFTNRIKFEDMKAPVRSADLDIFGKILRSYFSPDVSQSYFIEGNPSYEKIEKFGVIYNIRTYSSYQENDLFRMPTAGEKSYTLSERNKKVEELYPAFENDIKNFIADYGRTIRILGEDEVLILKIKLTQCEACSIPRSIEVSVKGSVLSQYDRQQITRDKALAAIIIKKNS
jgi:hypothetical protein